MLHENYELIAAGTILVSPAPRAVATSGRERVARVIHCVSTGHCSLVVILANNKNFGAIRREPATGGVNVWRGGEASETSVGMPLCHPSPVEGAPPSSPSALGREPSELCALLADALYTVFHERENIFDQFQYN